jgi:hypothetical protein
MLLHVVKAALPVDAALEGSVRRTTREDVGNLIALIDDVKHRDARQRAAVTGLPAGFRVECRSVKVDACSTWVRACADYARAEFS